MKYLRYWLMVIAVIILDQISKYLILNKINYHERIEIIPSLFDLTLVYNTGAAFSFLANHNGWQKYFFIIFAIIISAWLVREIRKGQMGKWGNMAAAMIIGGAMGNVIDRIYLGKVVDFILFYYQSWYYPAFNIADSFICIGAVLLVIDGWKHGKANKAA